MKTRVMLLSVLCLLPMLANAGNWRRVKHDPPVPEIIDPTNNNADLGPGGASLPILMTDGSVIIQNVGYFGADGKIFKLTPDSHGSYIDGTWSELATMPYVGVFGAQAVLPDGRVIIEGGEYSNYELDFTLTNQGAVYDPVSDSWTLVSPPPFFVDLYPPRATFAPNPIGDSQSVVLPDGTFMLADKMSRQAALLDANTLTWTETGTATKGDMNDEEGWVLLPDGKVLTTDCYTDFFFGLVDSYPADPTASEIYDPNTSEWSYAGSTLNSLTDPGLAETGAAVLRPDGSVFAVGSMGYTAIYDSNAATWKAGPRLPVSPTGNQYTAEDAPGALLPSGNVLFAATKGPGDSENYAGPPVAFFEFDGKKLIPVHTVPHADIDTSSSINLLVLPTGQVLATDGTNDVEIYTPDRGRAPDPNWAPVIQIYPHVVGQGGTYSLSGIRLNGMSQASMYGDEGQDATNYPLLRFTHRGNHHVRYARTHHFSSMAVANNSTTTMQFDVPTDMELGLSTVEVVTNGIASAPVTVLVRPGI